MLPNSVNAKGPRPAKLILCAALALALSACGGGGGNPGAVGGGGTPTTPGTGTPGTPAVAEPRITVTLVDGAGASVNSLSGGQSGVIRATLVDSAGKPAPNAIVKFSASDASLVEFTPASASALTDASGVAVMSVKPAAVTSAGALALTAEGVVGGKAASGAVNIAVGAAPLSVGALSLNPVPVGRLPAFSTVSVNIPVTSGGQPATSVTGLNLTSLCVGQGAATIVPGTLANGIQTATYTNKGCLLGTDTITASIGNSSQTIQVGVDAASIGTMQFVSSDLNGASIVLKGSGGLGRKESALLTFRVLDRNNNGLAGVDVSFRATTTTGGLTVLPATGTTDANGNVTTTVSSGTIPTPVRIIAEATRNGATISGLSDTLTVSTGLPIQKSMSLSVEKYNIEGWRYDGEKTLVTVMLADQYGNPISDSTAVNFVTEGGAVGSSAQGACITQNGSCSVELRSQNFRPTNGRVTVLAYAQGVENFVDMNGDGQFSCANPETTNGTYRPLINKCNAGPEPHEDMGDAFLDTDFDTLYEPADGDLPVPYNSSTYRPGGDGQWGINYIRRSTEVVFSDSDPILVRQACDAAGVCRDWTAADGDMYGIAGVAGASCSARVLTFRLYDRNNNPLPVDTAVTAVEPDKLAPGTMSPSVVPSTNEIGGTIHWVTVKPSSDCSPGSFGVKVMTPKGHGKQFMFRSI